MATISPRRGFSVATVAKGWLLVYMLMPVRYLAVFHSGNNKKSFKKKSSSVRCVKIKVSAFYFSYIIKSELDDRKNHDCDVLMCELILNLRLWTWTSWNCFRLSFTVFFLPNSIKFIMDRPVEKLHVKELKEILFMKKVSLKGLTVKAQLVAKLVVFCLIVVFSV